MEEEEEDEEKEERFLEFHRSVMSRLPNSRWIFGVVKADGLILIGVNMPYGVIIH